MTAGERFDRFFGRGGWAALLLCYMQFGVWFVTFTPHARIMPEAMRLEGGIMCVVIALALVLILARWSRRKGLSAVWGVMGMLNMVGVIVVAALPDRTKDTGRGFAPIDPRESNRDRMDL